MAKIEMDISEYEAMKETKKVLEQSLERERGLQAQIETLNKEKITALEDAKMKVVKVSKRTITEHLLTKRPAQDVFRELELLVWRHQSGHRGGSMADYYSVDEMARVFFTKTTSQSAGHDDEITTHGLDEIKAELRQEIKSQIDGEIQQKLTAAEQSLSKYAEVLARNGTLETESTVIAAKNKVLVETATEAKKAAED